MYFEILVFFHVLYGGHCKRYRATGSHRAGFDVDVTPRTGCPVGRMLSIRWPCVTHSVQWRKSWKGRLSSLAKDSDLIHVFIINKLLIIYIFILVILETAVPNYKFIILVNNNHKVSQSDIYSSQTSRYAILLMINWQCQQFSVTEVLATIHTA